MTETDIRQATLLDYIKSANLHAVLFMLPCTLIGMFLASPELPPLNVVVPCLLGVALLVASSSLASIVVKPVLDYSRDNTLDPSEEHIRFGEFTPMMLVILLAVAGMEILFEVVNDVTGFMSVASLLGYQCFLSMHIKYTTSRNILFIGLFAATPVLLGWTAVTNSLDLGGFLLVLIIFLWTSVYLWIRVLNSKKDYLKFDIVLLPITHDKRYARRQILYFVAALSVAGVLPAVFGTSGILYLISAILLGAIFLLYAFELDRKRRDTPIFTATYSIGYLSFLCLAMLADHLLVSS